MLNPCGVNCEDCGYYKKECSGCREVSGKPFWAKEHTEKGICPIYDCSVNDKKLDHCGKCSLLPCKTFNDLRDPSWSDEEFQNGLRDRIAALRSEK